MVHAPALAQARVARRCAPTRRRGRCCSSGAHAQGGCGSRRPLTTLNPGSLGGGGTGNLADGGGDIGLARLTFTRLPSFQPRAADIVQIDPGDGDARARRYRLDLAGR